MFLDIFSTVLPVQFVRLSVTNFTLAFWEANTIFAMSFVLSTFGATFQIIAVI